MPGTNISPPPKVSPPVASQLNDNQSQFAAELAGKTGLSGTVIAAWLLAEEPKSASAAPWGANNWLNIGGPQLGPQIASNTAWADPTTAADLTASWLNGSSIPGFGKAVGGELDIIKSASKSDADQIKAIQASGWAGPNSYPNLPSLYHSIDKSTSQAITDAAKKVTGAVSGVVNTAGDVASGIGNIATLLTSTEFWLRVGEAIAGVLLIYLGLHALTGQSSSIRGQGQHIKTKVKVVPVPLP
jgi:hypothetical protein